MKNLKDELIESDLETAANEQIAKNIQNFGELVQPRHLEIETDRIIHERIQQACSCFNSFSTFKTPKGKLNLIINFSKVISMMLQETSKDGRPDGADMFFPCSVYALLQLKKQGGDAAQIASQFRTGLAYIRHFRQEAKMCGEDEYYFTTIESAVEFISNLNETYKTDLKLTEADLKYFQQRLNNQIMSLDEMLTKSFEETKA